MAQVLKENVKQKILKSAKSEFFKNGYENSSLRKISKNANITVGNLYRYYPSKDKIYEAVVNESYTKLNKIIEKHTFNNFKLDTIPTKAAIETIENADEINFNSIVKNIINDVGTLFENDYLGLLILLKDDNRNENINSRLNLQNWFSMHFTLQYPNYNISKYLSYSFTEGLIKILLDEDNNKINEKVEAFISFYFEKGRVKYE
ncbi:TetR/AcrR family transcriptional regulator [Helicovermis profundi]|uniref:HTH tetR-type domain-containing protein n=1 Tax=Helicovermis profundi TaxID=3065157 RepID=A0AAU9E4R5_9FIRM|nr:hypothetical protein HLPR_19870 [Clostridia bacterium S502]